MIETNSRVAAADVDQVFPGRWSPRSFLSDPLSEREIAALFEAARWAPSASNLQPWLFVYETDGPDREVFDSILLPGNQRWAPNAPLLGFIFARRRNAEGRELRTGQFDTGSAWMSLTIQARLMGLYTHGMAGIDREAVYERLGVPEDEYTAICAFVAGRIGPMEALPEDLQERERPSERRPAGEFAVRGMQRG